MTLPEKLDFDAVKLVLMFLGATWVGVFFVRLIGAPARLYEDVERRLGDKSAQLVAAEEKLKPQFKLSFHPSAEGLEETPILIPVHDMGAYGARTIMQPHRGMYVRIRVEATSKKSVRNCPAFLTRLEKENEDGNGISEIRLPHRIPLNGGQLYDAHQNTLSPIDFLMSRSSDNRIVVTAADQWPLALADVLAQPGTYRFTIAVVGDDLTDAITIAVTWHGKWNGLSARVVSGNA